MQNVSQGSLKRAFKCLVVVACEIALAALVYRFSPLSPDLRSVSLHSLVSHPAGWTSFRSLMQ